MRQVAKALCYETDDLATDGLARYRLYYLQISFCFQFSSLRLCSSARDIFLSFGIISAYKPMLIGEWLSFYEFSQGEFDGYC
jgi:hypothetical protein